ncbi:Alpha-ionylideneethane synthase aba3 [Paramyrothecium foliicola]|nr:Alpha-ionylideneethane synthase aba3 [Paramyrothecium foliicola]
MPDSFQDTWYFPPDIADDLAGLTQVSEAVKQEAYACAWEYTRCVIPQYTNWNRYVAFMRTIIMAIFAEFRGDLVDVTATHAVGYPIDEVLADLFKGTAGHASMVREFKAFLLISADKASDRRHDELFRRYVNGLVVAPRTYFRMRDCDALARFTIAAALACNDMDDVWPSNDEFEVLAEIADTLYDSVAYYKHRSEGETNTTFAYVPAEARVKSFRVAREILWALDVFYSRKREGQVLMNFVRFFGGPIHMLCRRYRFVEEDLTIGKAEDATVVSQTRRNFKLWNRVEGDVDELSNGHPVEAPGMDRFRELLKRGDELMFQELPSVLEKSGQPHCDRCLYRLSYGANQIYSFGGVELCHGCRAMWRGYVESLPERVQHVFPEIVLRAPLSA